MILGGCLCKAIRYSAEELRGCEYCHCTTCRKQSGGPVSAWAEVSGFEVTSGTPSFYVSSAEVRRSFCGACGSTLWYQSSTAKDPDVAIGSLDDPSSARPSHHLCADEQLAWFKHGDKLRAASGSDPSEALPEKPLRGPADPSVSASSTVSLREVTKDNLRDVLFLDVAGPQRRFVASNAISLAQGLMAGDAWIRAIYADEVAVGFVMAANIEEDEYGLPVGGQPNLWRFLIDERYQGLGFGRRSLELFIAEVKTWPQARLLSLGSMSGIGSPLPFYLAQGFTDTGVVDESGERILTLDLTEQ